jgi:GNAT superfamily N-acetyltransferase
MQIPLEIRSAKLTDASTISELVCSVAQSCLGDDATPFLNTVSSAAIESYIQNPIYSYALGFLDNELVGIAAMRDKKHFYHLFVSPNYHYNGIAKSLWHHLKSDAVSNGINMFTVNSSIYAVPIYKKFGFLPTGEPQTRNGINYVPMQLSVPG